MQTQELEARLGAGIANALDISVNGAHRAMLMLEGGPARCGLRRKPGSWRGGKVARIHALELPAS